VKRVLCLLLVLWFALQAGLAHAHLVAEDLHLLQHAAQDLEPAASQDNDHGNEPCTLAHCCSPAGLLPTQIHSAPMSVATVHPSRDVHTRWHQLAHEIERPKWALATSTVASL
jgi:hypothetical protein